MEIIRKTLRKKVVILIKVIILLLYATILVSMIIGGLSAGIMTLIPDEASKPCYLGYYAHCSFTPFSTLILFAMTLIGSFLMITLIKYIKKRRFKAIETKEILNPTLNP